MNQIELWLQGSVQEPSIMRVDAVPVAECNLKCEHCFWPHGVRSPKEETFTYAGEQIARWQAPVVYAGRTLTKRGERFIEACFNRDVPLGIVDNGYTIWRREDFLTHYSHINISLDGSPEAHDRQRRKKGAFDEAWGTILRLKQRGYDPIVSSAFSPYSFDGWGELEARLREHDIPMSVSLVLSYPETVKRGTVVLRSDQQVRKGFEVLLSGMPKLINLYDLAFVRALGNMLEEFTWVPSETGDSLMAKTHNGGQIVYRPDSVIATTETVFFWDGGFYLPWGKEYVKLDDFSPTHKEQLRALNARERAVWESILR
ncbi:MAG TPA: hypothetical protein VF803_02340 [Candidatus Paceibacterota bacterium]